MSDDYDEIVSEVKEILSDYGRTVTLQKRSRTPANPDEPWNGPAAWDDQNPPAGHVVQLSAIFVGKGSNFQSTDFASTTSDKKGGFSFSRFDGFICLPSVDIRGFNVLIDGSDAIEIKAIHVLKPGDTVLLYGVEVSQ